MTCQVCGEEFKPKRNARICSLRCHNRRQARLKSERSRNWLILKRLAHDDPDVARVIDKVEMHKALEVARWYDRWQGYE